MSGNLFTFPLALLQSLQAKNGSSFVVDYANRDVNSTMGILSESLSTTTGSAAPTVAPVVASVHNGSFFGQLGPDVLRIVAYQSVPYGFGCGIMNLKGNDKCSKPGPGVSFEILNYLIQYQKIKTAILPISGRVNFGTVDSPSGLLGQVLSGRIDTLAITQQNSYRFDMFDYSYPVYQVEPLFLMAKPDLSFITSSMLIFRVFSLDLWVVFIVAMVSLVFFIYTTPKITDRRGMNPEQMEYPLWEYFRYCMDQCFFDMTQPTLSGNAALVCLGFVVVLWISLYQGCLLTQLLHPPSPKVFSSSVEMIDMVKSGRYSMITTDENDWYFAESQQSNDTYFVRLRNALDKNPLKVESNLTLLLDKLESSALIFPVDQIRAKYILKERCNLVAVAGTDLPKRWFSYIFRKGSRWPSVINRAIIMTQTYVPNVIEKYTSESVECRRESGTDETTISPLNMISMSGLFFVLLVGCATAIVGFVLERIYGPVLALQRKSQSALAKSIRSTAMLGVVRPPDINPEED